MAQNAPAGISPGFAQDAGGELNGKWLELLKETLPNLTHVGILWNPGVASNRSQLRAQEPMSTSPCRFLLRMQAHLKAGPVDASLRGTAEQTWPCSPFQSPQRLAR
jgi:hypothetical protein